MAGEDAIPLVLFLVKRANAISDILNQDQMATLYDTWWQCRNEFAKSEIKAFVEDAKVVHAASLGRVKEPSLNRHIGASGRSLTEVTNTNPKTDTIKIGTVRLHLLQGLYPDYYRLAPASDGLAYADIQAMKQVLQLIDGDQGLPLHRETYEWADFGIRHLDLLTRVERAKQDATGTLEELLAVWSCHIDDVKQRTIDSAITQKLIGFPEDRVVSLSRTEERASTVVTVVRVFAPVLWFVKELSVYGNYKGSRHDTTLRPV